MYDEETAECFLINLTETDVADDENENNSVKNPEEIEWHISSPESVEDNDWFEEELSRHYANTVLITTVGYNSSKDELEEIYLKNIKTKQVIAEQSITRGGSQCTFSCDTENHHVHTYCKACKKNLLYGTIIHDCVIGYGLGKIQSDMRPEYLKNDLWWEEPLLVQHENLSAQLHFHLGDINNAPLSPSY
jgi:hypothetical protein